MDSSLDVCALLPAYNEGAHIAAVVQAVAPYVSRVVVVDDGSEDETALRAREAGAHVLVHDRNRGKGVALKTGFTWAADAGVDAVITLDADGQHEPAEIPDFVDAYCRTGAPVIIGNRMGDPRGMPLVRRLTNRFMSWLLSRRMGQVVPDTQSGYRLIGKAAIPHMDVPSEGFAAESEVLLRLSAKGIRMGAVPIRVIYGSEKSKIRPVRDTIRFFCMLWRYNKQNVLETGKE